ncbi:MAG TPA: dienelactone hydrolase family protein, partial [Terriglobales bacterium]|nr:dienelactone hydrolase family protein [Terriglobales bacterium]
MRHNQDRGQNEAAARRLSRRDFMGFAAGFAALNSTVLHREHQVVEMEVDVKTPDGICDAVFIHPARGSHPGVLLWHDSPGLRLVIRDLGKRIAVENYSVLVPNLFYRAHRVPVFDASFNYANT